MYHCAILHASHPAVPDPEVDIEAMIRGDLLNTASQTPDFDDGSGTVKVSQWLFLCILRH